MIRGILAGLLLGACMTLQAAVEAPYHWQNVTVGGGGFAPGIIFSEAERGLAYLRTDMGGAYRWDDGMQRWIPLQDAMSESGYFGIESLAPDPVDPDVVHMAAGMYKRDKAAMLRSFDRGETWEVTPVPFLMGGNEEGRGLGERLAVDPADTDVLFFGSRHDGLFRSADRGLSWETVESFPHHGVGVPAGWASNGGVSFVLFAPIAGEAAGSRAVFAGVADPVAAGVYRSDDQGKSWRLSLTVPSGLLPVKAAAGGGRVFVTLADGIGPNGIEHGAVYRLDLASGTWADVTPPPADAQGGFMAVSVSRQDPDIVAVATINRWNPHNDIYRSTDGGDSWAGLQRNSHRDVSDYPFLYWGRAEADFGWWIAGLAIDPFDSSVFAYTTGATVYRSVDVSAGETHWRPWVAGIEQTAVITLSSLPLGPSLLSGFGDISGFVHTDFTRSPRTMFTNPVFANTNTIDYAGFVPNIVVRSGTQPHRGDGTEPTLAWSEDHGFHWRPVTVPALAQLGEPARRYDLSGNLPMTVTADGSAFIFMSPVPVISRDRGATWTEIQGLPPNARPVTDRYDPERLYALHFDNAALYVSRDGGTRFEQIVSTGLPADIHADRPTNREHPWPLMAAPGQAGNLWLVSQKGLFNSTDGGKQFRPVAARIRSDPGTRGDAENCRLRVERLSFGKAAPDRIRPTLFAIGTCGDLRAVWRSDDDGSLWYRINDSQHEWGRRFRTVAGDMGQYGRVFIATDGRGILVGIPVKPEGGSQR